MCRNCKLFTTTNEIKLKSRDKNFFYYPIERKTHVTIKTQGTQLFYKGTQVGKTPPLLCINSDDEEKQLQYLSLTLKQTLHYKNTLLLLDLIWPTLSQFKPHPTSYFLAQFWRN